MKVGGIVVAVDFNDVTIPKRESSLGHGKDHSAAWLWENFFTKIVNF